VGRLLEPSKNEPAPVRRHCRRPIRVRRVQETHPTISLVTALPALPEPLTDGTVALRRFTLDDVEAVTRACQDPEIPRWTAGIPEPYEERHAREWITLHDRFWNEEGRAAFAFCDARSDELFGSMALGEVDFVARSAVAGYWAAPWARNSGATTRALRLACRWGFDVLGLNEVGLMTLPGNVASERVAEKAGFVLIGVVQDYVPPRALHPETRHEVNRWVLRANRSNE
jgi:RimJ/RimL family protein N-acetyltransferase